MIYLVLMAISVWVFIAWKNYDIERFLVDNQLFCKLNYVFVKQVQLFKDHNEDSYLIYHVHISTGIGIITKGYDLVLKKYPSKDYEFFFKPYNWRWKMTPQLQLEIYKAFDSYGGWSKVVEEQINIHKVN